LVVVDYGMGNLRSVAKAFEAVGPQVSVRISGRAQEIAQADRVVLPGQGALPDCMDNLVATGLRDVILRYQETGRPLMGVCVGEQMMFDWGEEGRRSAPGAGTQCLGLFPGKVRRFSDSVGADGLTLKVPHMGWNRVQHATAAGVSHPIWQGIPEGSYFYFLHSYFAVPEQPQHSIGWAHYGQRFTCAVARDNILATQFHPEKSASLGLRLYANFLAWKP
jgi:imidazole glycerol-phosphate synthase subunit HisH